jgi:hypothetical protein
MRGYHDVTLGELGTASVWSGILSDSAEIVKVVSRLCLIEPATEFIDDTF